MSTALRNAERTMKHLWLVRAGKSGDREDLALSAGIATIGWSELGDLNQYGSKGHLLDALAGCHPDANLRRLRNWAVQVWSFYHSIQIGDFVAMPLKKHAAIAFGRVKGPHKYRTRPYMPCMLVM